MHKLPLLALLLAMLALTCAAPSAQAQTQSVAVNSSWVEYDVEENGVNGIRFHYNLVAHGYEGATLVAAVFIYNGKQWMMQPGDGTKYTKAEVAMTCNSPDAYAEDLTMFMPYRDMALADSSATYYYVLEVKKEGGQLKVVDQQPFDWGKHSPTAWINDIWVEHNRQRGKEKGIMVFLDVEVRNNSNKPTQFCCQFYDSEGNAVITPAEQYGDSEHRLRIDTIDVMGRGYRTHFGGSSSKKFFIPYSAFPQLPGRQRYDLICSVRDPERNFANMANADYAFFLNTGQSEAVAATPAAAPQTAVTASLVQDNTCVPVITWKADYESPSPDFLVLAGISSASDLTQTSLTVNGTQLRGMHTVRNEGFDRTINQKVSLREGSNDIVITATNACGTKSLLYQVTFNPPTAAPVQVDKRVALVIGNANYSNRQLRNPVNDAKDVGAALTALGFEVEVKTDVGLREMRDALFRLQERARDASVAVFYYAGHGVQYQNTNYLIPVNTEIVRESDIDQYCLNVNKVTSDMEASGCLANILILDACRDNPYETGGLTRSVASKGLAAHTSYAEGTSIIYATKAGMVAQDGNGRNSPFTTAFLETLMVPGLELVNFIRELRNKVKLATGNAQVPWMDGLLNGDFYFNPIK